jgi:hypothetical protein
MDPERWRRVEDLYHAALEQPAETRSLFLNPVCASDSELLREVESAVGCGRS